MGSFFGWLFLIGIAIATWIAITGPARQREREEKDRAIREKISKIVGEHLETLARRRMLLVKADQYGVVDASGWNKEAQHFLDKVIVPKLALEERRFIMESGSFKPLMQELIEDRVFTRVEELEKSISFSENLSPTEFEHWCSNVLAASGWKTTTTKASGDQGADVLAEKNGLRIVLQCKLYSSPVGNKAVQEAFTAKQHYLAQAAAVVSNAEYTKSAQEVAASTKVLLLHHSDLSRLDDLLLQRTR